ncbi:hypothetical protein [Chitinophaga niabensis]|uniref:Uncharacterized protein n=1 Tax=Chitinophaga niabensis TaxID=536979 RepID=A0A1N6K3P9_9BACT|nr:hypothetical protein [Chitinophaga niabensis]SIO51199.1 hypothetical protein SAMN04488055_5019 [Chitinophaga niabensis]
MKYLMLLAVLCLAACNSTLPPAAEDSTILAKDTALVIPANEEKEYVTDPVDTFTHVVFDDFKATLAPLVASAGEEPNEGTEPDTVTLEAGPGENMEGIKIYIRSDKLSDIKVEERLETHMAIATEEGFYELDNWKHGHTTWEELLKDNDSTFVTRFYSPEDYRIFPEVTLEEVKAAVKEQGGEEWLKHLKEAKTVKDDAFEILGDKYLLRVSGKRKSDGVIVTKIIIVYLTSGC